MMKELNIKRKGIKINGVEFPINVTSAEYIEKVLLVTERIQNLNLDHLQIDEAPKLINEVAGFVEELLGDKALEKIFGEDYSPGLDEIMEILVFVTNSSDTQVKQFANKYNINKFK